MAGDMLCLKAEALDDNLTQPASPTSYHSKSNRNNGANSPGGFVLPLNWGSSIHRYLKKTGRAASRSFSAGDGSLNYADFEETKGHEKINGRKEVETKCQYKYQLEEDVKKLQHQLQKEIDLRLALSSAVDNSDSPRKLPDQAQELLDSIAVLEITVSKLEQASVALQYQLSQERNERRLAEYHLRHFPSPEVSRTCSPSSLTEPMMEPCRKEEKQTTVDNLPLGLDVKEVPANGFLVENLWDHPNQLSEEMVCCMRDIFLFLADPSKISSSEHISSPCSPQGHLSYSSLTSFLDSPALTSLGRSSSLETDHGSEVIIRDTSFDPYKVPGKLEWTRSIGSYSSAVEVSWFSVGKKELEYAAIALKRFRMLVEQLARVNPSCMSCNEKLAFWINLYNALIMHAYLAYGVPKSDMKLFSLMQKAAYTIGGHSFSAAFIEYIILKVKPPAHRPQIALILALQKFKISEEQKQYSIDLPEPLLSFALSCGMHSSPVVRIFKPENVNEMLKSSLKDYVRASVGISDKGKLLVPKLLYCFAKGVVDESMVPAWISQYLSPEQAAMVRACSATHKWKLLGARSYSILPFDTRFRFLFLSEDKSLSSLACESKISF